MKFLVVDDELVVLSAMRKILNKYGTVLTASDSTMAARLAEKERPDVVFVDLLLHMDNGLDVIEKLRVILPNAEIILMTGVVNHDGYLSHEARASGGTGFLSKTDFGLIHVLLAEIEAKRRNFH